MKKLKEYEDKGFEGIDASLETSLYEYGLIWGKNEHTDKNGIEDEYLFVYRIEGCPNMHHMNQAFGEAYFTKKDALEMVHEGWFDFKKFSEYADIPTNGPDWRDTAGEYVEEEFPRCVFDMLSYHGYQNVFGDSYSNRLKILQQDSDNFAMFLEEHGVSIVEYVMAFARGSDYKGEDSFTDLQRNDEHNRIMYWPKAVDWDRMSHGCEFWESLDEEWCCRATDDADFGVIITVER